MNYLRRLINRLFRYEDLSPDNDESYLLRWTLFSGFRRKMYLHKILATDWAREPHDHPKDFVSIGLSGRYVEEVYEVHCNTLYLRKLVPYRAPWVRTFPAAHIHRLAVLPGEHAWTLCIVGPATRGWGFYSEDGTFTSYLDFMRERYGWE